MNKKLFERLVESMQQHEEIRRGERAPSREFFVDAEKTKESRAMTGLSQTKFARLLDADVGTLRNWEQDRRQPAGPARRCCERSGAIRNRCLRRRPLDSGAGLCTKLVAT